MPTPIILSAFGTSATAEKTYSLVKATVQKAFPQHAIFFGYSSKMIVKRLNSPDIQHPSTIINNLHNSGEQNIFLQPLHLIAGKDYHSLVREMNRVPDISVGIPLLYSEDDYIKVTQAISHLVSTSPDTATLILGHGTSHPSWIAYPALQHYCRKLLSPHIYVGTVEKSPDSTFIPQLLHEQGYKAVKIIPFLFVAGMHYKKDIFGDSPISWKMRLQQYDLEISQEEQGIGDNIKIQQLLCDHIKAVM